MATATKPTTKPLPQRQASTLFLRVPRIDWTRVKVGEKTEFRTRPREGSNLLNVNLPTPVVAYSQRPTGGYDTWLMVLLEKRYEPLFALASDPEGVAREGFDSYEEFRSYWRRRKRGRFKPMEHVYVWRVRNATPEDAEEFGPAIYHRLYGEYAA